MVFSRSNLFSSAVVLGLFVVTGGHGFLLGDELHLSTSECQLGFQATLDGSDEAGGHWNQNFNSEDVCLPLGYQDAAFDRFVDLRLLGIAITRRDPVLLTDIALQLCEGERVLMRKHQAGLTGQRLAHRAVELAQEMSDDVTLERLKKFASSSGNRDLSARIEAAVKLAGEARGGDPALVVGLDSLSVEALVSLRAIIDQIDSARFEGDKESLKQLRGLLESMEQIPNAVADALGKRIDKAVEETAELDEEDEVIARLSGDSRQFRLPGVGRYAGLGGFTGYRTDKWDLMRQQEDGGWVVAYSQDITESDLAVGVIATILGVLPAWASHLVDRTMDSLQQDARERFSADLRDRLKRFVEEVFRAAINGRSARQAFDQFGRFDFKAGAIRYGGANYFLGNVISRTWGLKLYVGYRIRPMQVSPGPSPSPSSLLQMRFNFDERSRDAATRTITFEVPGIIERIEPHANQHGSSASWSGVGSRRAVGTVQISRGRQRYPGGPREQHYYQGNVIVHYRPVR